MRDKDAVYFSTEDGSLNVLTAKEFAYVDKQFQQLSTPPTSTWVVFYHAAHKLWFSLMDKDIKAFRHTQKTGVRGTSVPRDGKMVELLVVLPEVLVSVINTRRFEIRVLDWDLESPLSPGCLVGEHKMKGGPLLLPELLCYLELRRSVLVSRVDEKEILTDKKAALLSLFDRNPEAFFEKLDRLSCAEGAWEVCETTIHDVQGVCDMEPVFEIRKPTEMLRVFVYDDQLDGTTQWRDLLRVVRYNFCRSVIAVVSCRWNQISMLMIDKVDLIDEVKKPFKQ
eukprot:Blabericola_migrator_1__4599@NODE_2440_length_2756_cov_61_828933_g1528_i0_p1_GENE_NODE_2440_length_2756_cov_61_828933_g1528_i0NODE_2440_length_2756_cov_61_828933_g1528_i0_p1_ORF_typecomplete_len281_score52_52DUF4303/PF14136_6/2_8e02DUF4303/PF14136_6/0_18_NODE_2440_length_2756_cov_61_828933_g1528_i09631805